MALARDQYLFLAKLAQQTERYEEMVTFIRQLVELVFSSSSSSTQLTVEERNLLSAAYKNVIGKLRAAWRRVSSIEQKEKEKERQINDDHVEHYRCNLEKELLEVCTGALGMLDKYLLPSAPSASEARVFYLRMKGDYHRYLTEFKAVESTEAAEDTLAAYKAAEDNAAAVHLSPAHPMRLGLALNICVFYYDILNESEKACDMAKQAIDDAISELDTLGQKSYKESTQIMQLLLDNFTLWTSNMQQKDN